MLKWTPEQHNKFKATMAAKKKVSKVTSIPLDVIPARAMKALKKVSGHPMSTTDMKLQLAYEVVKLVASILKEK